MNIQIRKYYDMEATENLPTGCEYPTHDDVKSQPISKMQAYINELVAENKALKEQNTILQNQNKDLLVSLERLKSE